MVLSITNDAPAKPSRSHLIAIGLLTVFFPYFFVWIIQKPAYPKAFRLCLTVWATIWIGSAILFFVLNITGLKPRG